METTKKAETMTTADYRRLAGNAEGHQAWRAAAVLWQKALDNYPESQRSGDLWETDAASMISYRNDCLAMCPGETIGSLMQQFAR